MKTGGHAYAPVDLEEMTMVFHCMQYTAADESSPSYEDYYFGPRQYYAQERKVFLSIRFLTLE